MDYNKSVVTTLKGGVVSAHPAAGAGYSKFTSNLFDNCWQEVTNKDICDLLHKCSDASRAKRHDDAIALLEAIHKIHAIKVAWVESAPDWYKLPGGSDSLCMSTVAPESTGSIPEVVNTGFSAGSGSETPAATPSNESNGLTPEQNRQLKQSICEELFKFFADWQFDACRSQRFIETLKHYCNKSQVAAITYITNYLKLTNHPDAYEIIPKLSCTEFKNILSDIKRSTIKDGSNKRIEIYYGGQGTGKTTKVMAKYPGIEMVPCNEQVLPTDIMKTFDFNDENGNPQFKKSEIRIAMEDGKPVGLEEAGLLPIGTQRFLQNFTDNKEYIDFEGERIFIKEGFKLIFTMNLVVNGICFPLPEPIVDRAFNIEEFTLTSEELAARL